MGLNIGELVGTISLDMRPWDSGLTKAQGDLGRLGTDGAKKANRAGALIGGAIGAGLLLGAAKAKDFAVGSVDAFAAVEDATGAAGATFGSALPQVLAFADKAGKSFNLSKRTALEAQNTFGTLGRAAGLQGAPLAGFAGKMTGLSGDLASFKGTSAEQAIEAVGAALRGEMEPIRTYGVLLDDSTLRLRAVRMGLIKNVKEGLTPSQKALAAQAEILAQTTVQQGDAAKTIDSTANTQKRLANETENAQVVLGQKLAPAVTWVRTRMLGLVQGMSSAIDVAIAMGSKMGDLAGFVSANRTPFLIVSGIIATLFLPHLIAIGVQSTIAGAKSAAAWVVMRASAVAGAAGHSLAMARVAAGWVLTGTKAAFHAVAVAASWVASTAGVVAAWLTAKAGMIAHWVAMKAPAVLHAGAVAASWVASTAGVVAAWVLAGTAKVGSMVAEWVLIAAKAVIHAAAVAASWVASTAGVVAAWVAVKVAVVAQWVAMKVASLSNATAMAGAWLVALGPVGWVLGILALVGAAIWAVGTKTRYYQTVWKNAWIEIQWIVATVWNNVLAPTFRWIIGGYANMCAAAATFYTALSHVPGFGWAKTAAAQMNAAAVKANNLAAGIRDIPASKKVTVTVGALFKAGSTAGPGVRYPLKLTGTGDGDGVPLMPPSVETRMTESMTRMIARVDWAKLVPAGGGVGGGALGGRGIQSMMAALRTEFPGLQATSGYRPGAITSSGNQSYHSMGRAVDLPPNMAVFNWIRSRYGATSKELIFTPAGGRQIKNGKSMTYGGQVAADHTRHIHWAYDTGGMMMPGASGANYGRKPERIMSGDQTDWFEAGVAASGGRGGGTDMSGVRADLREQTDAIRGLVAGFGAQLDRQAQTIQRMQRQMAGAR